MVGLSRDRRPAVVAAACAVLLVAFIALGLRQPRGIGPLHNPTDLVAFYCGSRAAMAGADPYRSEPLRSCERAAFAESGIPLVPGLVVPAPLPGWDFALFAPLGLLPFRLACAVWLLVLAGAIATTALLLVRLTGLRPAAVIYALAGADAWASISLGQMVPLVLLAIVGCAYALRLGRERFAAAAACATLVEPHLGLPVLLALAVFVPRTRAVLVLGGAIAATLALATIGSERCIEYVRFVLPAQARGEGLEFHRQYGLSALLHVAGVGEAWALRAGSLSYLAMLALGLALGRHAQRVTGDRALLIVVPAAVALIGGAYVHIAQIAVALPLALVLVARLSGTARRYAIAATICLAIPWQTIFSDPLIAELFPPRGYIDPGPLLAKVAGAGRLAEEPWDAWLATIVDRDRRTLLEILLGKIPTWFGLVACAALAAHLQPSRAESVARPDTGSESIRSQRSRRERPAGSR